MRRSSQESSDDNEGDGPKIKVTGSGRMRDWIVGGMMALTLLRTFFPGASSAAADKADAEARLAPLYEAINALKLTIGQVDSTLGYHTEELADHETRLRAQEQHSSFSSESKVTSPGEKP